MFVVSKFSGVGGVGVLTNWMVLKPRTVGPLLAQERLVRIAEVVEGVVGRRGGVVDRLEAGVNRGSQCRSPNKGRINEEDRAVLAHLRENALVVGVMGLAGERARRKLAEEVQRVRIGGTR